VPNDNLIRRPGEMFPYTELAIVVGSYADPVAAPEADISSLGGHSWGCARCIDLGNFNAWSVASFRGFAVPNSRNACVPRVDHGCEGDQLIYFAATILRANQIGW